MLQDICEILPNEVSVNMKGKVFWFHGEPGTWKTTVASKFPRALIVGFEIGYQFINGVRAVPITSWSDAKDLFRQLKTPKARETYDTIVFDTISGGATMCYKYALGQLGITDPQDAAWGKGWRAIKDEWRIIQDIVKLGYCVVFISHSKETEIVDDKTKQSTLKVKTDLDSWCSGDIWGLSDSVFYVRKELQEDGRELVYAYSDLPNIDTKRRHPAFPSRIYFSYDEIVNGLNNVVEYEKSLGNNVSDANVRVVEEKPWTEYRDEVIELITALGGTVLAGEMEKYIVETFPDVRISQTTEFHKDKLIAARDHLLELKLKL